MKRFFIELSLPIDNYRVFFYVVICYAIFSEKGEGLDPLNRLIPLQMFAPVLSQEFDVQ